jgi:hypothetical protein
MTAAVLIVSADAELLDDLLRLAAAADVEASVASDAVRARSAWRDAALVVAGPDLSAELADCAPPHRPGVILGISDPDREGVYRLAVDIGAQDVAPPHRTCPGGDGNWHGWRRRPVEAVVLSRRTWPGSEGNRLGCEAVRFVVTVLLCRAGPGLPKLRRGAR